MYVIQSTNLDRIEHIRVPILCTKTHPRFVVMCVCPVPVKFDDVRMFEPCEVVEHHLYLVFLSLEVFSFRELDFVPDNLDPFLCVHSEVRTIDTWDISLFDLKTITSIN